MPHFADQLKWLDAQDDLMRQTLRTWAAQNTFTDNIPGLNSFADFLLKAFTQLPATAQRLPLPPRQVVDDAGNIILKPVADALLFRSKQRAKPLAKILLAIHMDTVYPPDAPGGPVTLDGDLLRGPGVADAKGGLLIMLYALLALEQSPFVPNIAWQVLINPDEEVGSPSSAPLFLQAAKQNDIALLFEPALPNGMLASSRRGSGNWSAILRGRAAHAGRDPENGRNAINAAAELIARLEELGKSIPGASLNVGMIKGGGPVNVVPDLAVVKWNARADSPTQVTQLAAALEELLEKVRERDGIQLELHGGFHCPPKPLDAPTEHLLQAIQSCGQELHIPITWKPTGGACDGNKLAAAGLPTVDSLGVRGGEIHSNREFCELPSLTERAKLVALLLMKIGAGEIHLPKPTEEKS